MSITDKIKSAPIVKNLMGDTQKPEKVKVHKRPKTERKYERVTDVKDYLAVLSRHESRVAVSYFDKKRNVVDVTYSQFTSRVKRVAAGLTELGFVDKRIAVIGETSYEWITSYLGILSAGNVVIPMDKELEVGVIEDFLAWVDADAIVYSDKFIDAFESAKTEHKSLKLFIPMSDCKSSENDKGVKTICYSDVVSLGNIRVNNGYEFPDVTDREKLAEYLFTSGTTGTSKAVMLSQKNIFSVISAACEAVEFTPDDTIMSVLPIHHTYELACFLSGLVYGMHICINDTISHLLKNLQIFKPTGLVLVPLFVYTMYKRIWAEAKKTGRDRMLKIGIGASKALSTVGVDKKREILAEVHKTFGGRLEKIVCGGAALNPKMIEFFDALGISIYEGYGITECAPLTCVSPYFARKYGSVGPSVGCCQVRIDGEALGEKGYVEGEIQVKGDNVMIGYFDNDEATKAAFTCDGWFRTGDMGYMDNDGYLFITGRLKTVIVLENGKNVFPEEIEEYLGDIEKIAECVVVGRSESRTDKVDLTAIVYPDYTKYDESAADEEILADIEAEIAEMNKKLPTYKQVHRVELRSTEFEKTTSRKIKRHLVK